MIDYEDYSRALVDLETGEATPINDNDIVNIISAKTIAYLNKTIEINKGKKFTKVIDLPFKEIAQCNLTKSSYDVLMVMLGSLGWGVYSGFVIKLKNKQFNGFMNGKDLQALTLCSKSAFIGAITQLRNEEIIKTIPAIDGRGNNYIVNPFIATHDKRIPTKIFKLFENTKFNYTHESSSQLNSNELKARIREERKKTQEQIHEEMQAVEFIDSIDFGE